MTIAEALAAADGTEVVVSGTVIEINTAWSDSYGNISVTIADRLGLEKKPLIAVRNDLFTKPGTFELNIIYSEEVIEQTELEEKGLKCHLRWSKTVEDKAENLLLYNTFEYYRKSSMSEVLYSELRRSLGIELVHDEELVSDYEHRRWNAYMRTEGYVYNKTRDYIAKTHPSLIVFDDLSQAEKDKDTEVLKASDVD